MFPKSLPSICLIFCNRMDVKKPERVPLLARQFGPTFGSSESVEENTWHFEVLVLFLSFSYGADLCRSRLISSNSDIFRSVQSTSFYLIQHEKRLKKKTDSFTSRYRISRHQSRILWTDEQLIPNLVMIRDPKVTRLHRVPIMNNSLVGLHKFTIVVFDLCGFLSENILISAVKLNEFLIG